MYLLICMDSGFYDKDIVAECERLGIGFSITAEQTEPLKTAVHALAEDRWSRINDKLRVSDLSYQPIKWPGRYRYVLSREEIPSGSPGSAASRTGRKRSRKRT